MNCFMLDMQNFRIYTRTNSGKGYRTFKAAKKAMLKWSQILKSSKQFENVDDVMSRIYFGSIGRTTLRTINKMIGCLTKA
jgi:hypothetical protein